MPIMCYSMGIWNVILLGLVKGSEISPTGVSQFINIQCFNFFDIGINWYVVFCLIKKEMVIKYLYKYLSSL